MTKTLVLIIVRIQTPHPYAATSMTIREIQTTPRPSAATSMDIRDEIERLKEPIHTKGQGVKLTKRKIDDSRPGRRNVSVRTHCIPFPSNFNPKIGRLWSRIGLPLHFLFEFASGYALFYGHGANEVDMLDFESAEKYINCSDQTFTLEAFHLFSSTADALIEMNAISQSTVTEQLKSFLVRNLPKPIDGEPSYFVAVSDALLGDNITVATRMPNRCGIVLFNLMRGLRMKLDKFIGSLEPGDLEKAQLKLARLYSRQRCTATFRKSSMAVSSSSLQQTKNEDTEVEYRLWNPLRSKLAAAIMCGLSNICVKPGSRVLCLGDVCGNTISHLCDLVGWLGLCSGVVRCCYKHSEEGSNVVPIFEDYLAYWKYRMVVGMVDVIFADIDFPRKVKYIALTARFYLRAGGHYMIYTRANNIDSTSQDPFADHFQLQREFKPIELVRLEPIERDHVMVVGGFRMLEE
ncbi:hypothetical protein OROMI_019751 [Orobanche minor]